MSDDEHSRHGSERHLGPARTSPYPVSRLAAPHDLVDMAREIQKADAMLGAVAANQLQLIAEQIRALQEQAREILETTRRDAELHRARCQFQKRPGKIYHLYRDGAGRLYFSMLSPEDWKGTPPDPYEGSFRLEADLSWTPVEEIAARDARRASTRRLLDSNR
jgi:hypothetical protein